MPVYRTLLAVLVCVSLGRAAELKTLKGDKITGELVSVSDKEIVLAKGTEKLNYDISQVLEIGLAGEQRIPGDMRYLAVELTDGSLLSCGNMVIRGKEVELTLLLTGQSIKLPLGSLANVLTNANVKKYRKDWTDRLKKKKQRDILALVSKDDVINGLECLLGEGDAEGKTFTFTLASKGTKKDVPQDRIHGLIFQRTADPQAAPVRFKLIDAYKNLIMVSSVTSTPTGLTVTTPAGARLEYTSIATQLVKLDYSRGKQAYLSDLPFARPPDLRSNVGADPVVGLDRNPFSNEPIRLASTTFSKGLVLRAFTELEYDLGGEYREFRAFVGVDDSIVAAEHKTILRIEADGKVLDERTISRKDKERKKELILNIKDVQKLRIIVTSNDWVDLGKHVTLADAMVSK